MALTLFALAIVSTPTAVPPPIVPKLIVPEVPAFKVKLPGPFTVLKVMLFPAEAAPLLVVSSVALPVNVVVPETPIVPALVITEEVPELKFKVPKEIPAAEVEALTVPKIVVVLAVLVNPPAKVRLGEEPLFKVTPPVLIKVVAGVIVPPLLKTRLYPCAAVENAVDTLTAPLNVMAPVVFVNVTVGTVVVPVIVVPPLFVTVNELADKLPPIETVFAAPGLTVNPFEPPVTFPVKLIAALVVPIETGAVKVAGPVTVTVAPLVVMFPPTLMPLVPV